MCLLSDIVCLFIVLISQFMELSRIVQHVIKKMLSRQRHQTNTDRAHTEEERLDMSVCRLVAERERRVSMDAVVSRLTVSDLDNCSLHALINIE